MSFFKFRLILFLAVVIIGYGSIYVTNWLNASKNKAAEFYNRGVEQAQSGEMEKAIVNFEEAIKLHPEYSEAWLGKGAALCSRGKYEEGISCFDKALEINPEYAVALKAKGLAFYEKKKYDEAIICFDKAMKINPGDGELQNLKNEAEKAYQNKL